MSTSSRKSPLSEWIVSCIEEDNPQEVQISLEEERKKLGMKTAISKPVSTNKRKKSLKDKIKDKAVVSKEETLYATFIRNIVFLACSHDAFNCVRLLIAGDEEQGQMPMDAVDETGCTALHHAARHQSTQCIELLFQNGASNAIRNKQGFCPLEEALHSSDLQIDFGPETSSRTIVEQLREKDLTSVRIIAEKSRDLLVPVAFQLASQLQLVPLVALLLVSRASFINSVARGSDYTGCEDEGSGTLIDLLVGKIIRLGNAHDRLKQKQLDATGLYAWGGALETTPTPPLVTEESPLRWTAIKILEAVLCFNPKLSAHPQSSEVGPLLRAAQANDAPLVELFMDAGANVNETDSDGNTALHWVLRQATPGNRREVDNRLVKLLLEAGVNVLHGNKLGATPVHTAAGHGHAEALRMILEKERSGANVLAATKETPLHYAVKNNHLECTQVLLHYGSNRHVVSLRHQRPGQLAPSPEMRALLQESEPPTPAPSETPKSSDVKAQSSQQQSASYWAKPTEGANGTSASKTEVVANLPAYRTAMCRFYGSAEGCSYGSKCHFAHSDEELRVFGGKGVSTEAKVIDMSVKNFKTKLCQHYEKGLCPHGTKCKFAHGEEELRPFLSASKGVATGRPSTASSVASSGSDDEEYTARKVFVGGLPHFIKSEELGEHFEEEFGRVRDSVVICGIDEDGTQRSRGFGFVLFEDPNDAEIAVQKHWVVFAGRRVEVKRAQARIGSPQEHIEQMVPSADIAVSEKVPSVPALSVSSSAISSPQAPLSPTFSVRSKPEESVALFNDGVQLPSIGTGTGYGSFQNNGPLQNMGSGGLSVNPSGHQTGAQQGGTTSNGSLPSSSSGWALPPLSVPSHSVAQTPLPLPRHVPTPIGSSSSTQLPKVHHFVSVAQQLVTQSGERERETHLGNGFSLPNQGSSVNRSVQNTNSITNLTSGSSTQQETQFSNNGYLPQILGPSPSRPLQNVNFMSTTTGSIQENHFKSHVESHVPSHLPNSFLSSTQGSSSRLPLAPQKEIHNHRQFYGSEMRSTSLQDILGTNMSIEQNSSSVDPWSQTLYSHQQQPPLGSLLSNVHLESFGNGYRVSEIVEKATDVTEEDELNQLLALLDPGNNGRDRNPGGQSFSRDLDTTGSRPLSSRIPNNNLIHQNYQAYPFNGNSTAISGYSNGTMNGPNNSVYHLPSFNDFELSG